jgi:hypothetical protein
VKNVETSMRNLRIETFNGLYALKIKEAAFDKELMTLRIDSLEL